MRKGIAQLLEDLPPSQRPAGVRVVDPPPDVEEGWDLADAERDGWTADDVLGWIRQHVRPAQPRDPNAGADDEPPPLEPLDEPPRGAMSAAKTTPPDDAAADPAPDLSHDSLAYWLSREHFRGDARYVAAWGLWMLWDAVQWRADDRLRHLTLIRDYLRRTALTAPDPKTSRELRSDRVRSAVERTARSNPEIATSANVWDSDKWLLGTPGGTVDLRTGELRTPSREDFITRTTSVAPAEADPTRWRAFLERAFRSTPEIVPFLQRAAGYALTGETSEHKLLFAFGTGRNGKGVLMNTLTGLMGDYATVAPSATFLESGMDHHPTDLASLAGARLVTASELPPGKAWNEARIKSLTGGDPITARRMRQDFFTFDPQFTLMISGNHMPSFRGIDEAIRSRVLLIPFSEVIPPEERDPALQEKLRREWPAVLQWAIEGALAWQEHGLAPPECVQAASDEYLESEDLLGEFVDERLVGAPDGFVRVRELYAAFREWCQERGTHPWVQHTLTKTLKERGYMVIRRNVGNGLVGYRLLTSDAPSYRDLTQGW